MWRDPWAIAGDLRGDEVAAQRCRSGASGAMVGRVAAGAGVSVMDSGSDTRGDG